MNLDVPFLGAQNRIYLAGILSPFRSKSQLVTPVEVKDKTPYSEASPTSSTVGLSTTLTVVQPHQHTGTSSTPEHKNDTSDPLYNPPFANDIVMEKRDWWQNMVHFAQKHADEGFFRAGFRHWKEHFEFGSCLLNGQKLKAQYNTLRRMEDAKPFADGPTTPAQERVRFVQFYTSSQKGLAISRRRRRFPASEGEGHPSEVTVNDSARSFRRVPENDIESLYTNSSLATQISSEKELFFCKLAKQADGEVDPLWKKVKMATNDEINAHTILFLPGPHYQSLVNSVSDEIMQWVSS